MQALLPYSCLMPIPLSQKATLIGQVWYDLEKDGKYRPPPKGKDKPISKKRIYLVNLGSKSRAAQPASLGSAITDVSGNFKLRFDAPRTAINGGIKLDLLSNELIATVRILPGPNQREIPLLQPTKVGRQNLQRTPVSRDC
jgi:hypothetical protein